LKRRSFTFLLILLVLLVTGCGGGGTGGGGAAQDRLTDRMRSLSNALKSGSTDKVMANFSLDYYSGGTDYWDYRATVANFFNEGGRSWLENLQAKEFILYDATHADRRFTATQVVRIYGNTDRTYIDAWESFRLENGKWLIYGSGRAMRGTSEEQKLIFGALLKEQIVRVRALPPATTTQPEDPIPPDLP
jgi:hypothetical protein